ncbi:MULTISPECIES: EpsG family protein [Vibrio]|uniref:EpsG family protein n=1 Tax=Vibrio TaxID=662 RepID=UPI001482897F|nr:EpsG family protein [Vibrio sp. F12]
MIFLLLIGLMLSVFVGFRWSVGSDWDVYLNHYNIVQSDQFEFGYVFVEKIFYSNHLDYSYFLFFITLVPIFLISYFLFSRVDYAIVAIMFFIANYMLSFMGGNRQIIAIGIVFFSNIFILNRNKIGFISCILFACLFHVSAIIYIVAYFFTIGYVSTKKRYLILFGCVLLGAYIAPVLIGIAIKFFSIIGVGYVVDKLTIYQSVIFDNFSIMSMLKKVIILILFDLYYQQVLSKVKKELCNLFYNLYFFSLIFDAVVGPINAAFMRASVYFRISEIVIVSLIVATAKNKLHRVALILVLFLLCLRQLNSALNFYPELYINYQNVLF